MSTMRTGLVGFGFIAERGHVPAFLSGKAPFHVTAVAEPCHARWSLIERMLPAARIYPDHRTMLAKEPLDVVDICTPPSAHAEIALAAFERGAHVLCEKPLAMDGRQARHMVAAAQRAGRVLYPGHSYRFAPVLRAARGALQSGRIGKVHLATVATYRTTHARGVPEWNPDWRRDPKFSGGGILMDHGPHTFYLAFEWLGGYPTEASAETATLGGGAVEDDVVTTLRFPDGGLLRSHLTWNSAFRKVVYTIHGDRGGLRIEDDELEVITKGEGGRVNVERSSFSSHWMDAGHGPWFEGLLIDFARAIAAPDLVHVETEDSVRAMEAIEAAYASAREQGRSIAIGSSLTTRRAAA